MTDLALTIKLTLKYDIVIIQMSVGGFSEFEAGHCFVSWKAWQLSFVARERFKTFPLQLIKFTREIYKGTALLCFANINH